MHRWLIRHARSWRYFAVIAAPPGDFHRLIVRLKRLAETDLSELHFEREILMLRILCVVAVAATGFWAAADPTSPDPDTIRPIEAVDSVFTEDLTWMEIRDAMHAGKRTVIIATGGIEQNGPYLVTGKHNIVLRATTEALARKLGDALVAPIIPFVPEGDIQPAHRAHEICRLDQLDRGDLRAAVDRDLRKFSWAL